MQGYIICHRLYPWILTPPRPHWGKKSLFPSGYPHPYDDYFGMEQLISQNILQQKKKKEKEKHIILPH